MIIGTPMTQGGRHIRQGVSIDYTTAAVGYAGYATHGFVLILHERLLRIVAACLKIRIQIES
jgi:hypothetical protein